MLLLNTILFILIFVELKCKKPKKNSLKALKLENNEEKHDMELFAILSVCFFTSGMYLLLPLILDYRKQIFVLLFKA